MKHALIWIGIPTLILGASFLAWVNYSLYWPITTLVIQNYSDAKPIPVLTSMIEPGEPLQYELDYCKYTNRPAVVHRSFMDGQIILLQDSSGKLPTGCHKTLVKTAIVPETINPGEYYLDVSVDYTINPLRTITTHYRTTEFTVVRKGTLPKQATIVATSTLPIVE